MNEKKPEKENKIEKKGIVPRPIPAKPPRDNKPKETRSEKNDKK